MYRKLRDYKLLQWRRPGAEFWGDGNIFRGPRFLNCGFLETIPIFTAKISDDLFYSWPAFRISPFFSKIFRIFTMIWPFPHKKNHYFRKEFLYETPFLFGSYFRALPTTLLLKILWGDGFMGRPHLKFLGNRPPSPPLGLRPWTQH